LKVCRHVGAEGGGKPAMNEKKKHSIEHTVWQINSCEIILFEKTFRGSGEKVFEFCLDFMNTGDWEII
jgi:hypothetical protein